MGLESYLVLARYHLDRLGVKAISELSDWQRYEDDLSGDEQTVFFRHALARAREGFAERLPEYDRRIRTYEEYLAAGHANFRGFKYFQYLVLLFTEHHLDRLTEDPHGYLADLNRFLDDLKARNEVPSSFAYFRLEDLRRPAIYLATGAGKTYLLHVHYWQVYHYLNYGSHKEALAPRGKFGHVLLLAPNEGLADQHLRDLERSGIFARRLTGVKHDPSSVLPGTVLVVDMPKLRGEWARDESDAQGVYYPMLGRANLVFADEGHKGTGQGEGAWRKIREYLSEEGMLWEYSATFAQVLSKEGQKIEYGKRILADYQYRYFYRNGYGKDFEPINVAPGGLNEEETENRLLMGGLLLYYRQLSLYEREKEKAALCGIKRPLWIFVGHTVVREAKGKLGSVEEDVATLTDVAKVVRFVKRFLEEPDWAHDLLTGAVHEERYLGEGNPFAPHFTEFQNQDAKALYQEICRTVFDGTGTLELHILPARGEIGLKVSGGSRYFGLVHIGDTDAFAKLLRAQMGLEPEENPFFVEQTNGSVQGRSLFAEIDRETAPVDLLIGSRRFIEGWSTWRVSVMTLLNMGQGEGPQVIQLFGRGVRLLGRNRSLKRSGEPSLKPLETLYVLGLRADYMEKFLSAIDKEEVLEEEISLDLEIAEEAVRKPLPFFDAPDLRPETYTFVLEAHAAYSPRVNLATRVAVVQKETDKLAVKVLQKPETRLTLQQIALLCWPRVVARLRAYARDKGYAGLCFERETLREILQKGFYALYAEPRDLETPDALEAAALSILRAYLDRFYRKKVQELQTQTSRPGPFDDEKIRLPRAYTVRAKKGSDVLRQIQELQQDIRRWRQTAPAPLPRLYLDPQLIILLYQPLIHKELPDDVHVQPAPLEPSEERFLRELRDFWRAHREEYPEIHLYLMRNPSRSGLGFHHRIGFYPDFVLWVERPQKWRIVFVEPHGMRQEKPLDENPKVEVMTQVLPALSARPDFRDAGIELDGYFISDTPASGIPGVEPYLQGADWDALAAEKRVLVQERGWDANIRTLIG